MTPTPTLLPVCWFTFWQRFHGINKHIFACSLQNEQLKPMYWCSFIITSPHNHTIAACTLIVTLTIHLMVHRYGIKNKVSESNRGCVCRKRNWGPGEWTKQYQLPQRQRVKTYTWQPVWGPTLSRTKNIMKNAISEMEDHDVETSQRKSCGECTN